MEYTSLGGSEETQVVFENKIPSHINSLSASGQRDLLTKLRNIANEDVSPDREINGDRLLISVLYILQGVSDRSGASIDRFWCVDSCTERSTD